MNNELARHLPQPFLGLFDKTVNGALAEAGNDDNKKFLIKEKVTHIGQVQTAGWEIMRQMQFRIPGTDKTWYIPLAAACLGLHDIGRFEEAVTLGVLANTNNRHNRNGVLAISKARRSDSDFESRLRRLRITGFDIKTVHQAIALHSDREYTGENPYVYLVRDADKLALLRALDYQHDWLVSSGKLLKGPVTDAVLADFIAGGCVDNKHVKSSADNVLRLLSWISDLNFLETWQLVRKSDIVSELRNRLEGDEHRPEILDTIDTRLNAIIFSHPISQGSALSFAPTSILQAPLRRKDGDYYLGESSLPASMHKLAIMGIVPERLIPDDQAAVAAEQIRIEWSPKTDAKFATVEELSDIVYHFIKFAILDRETLSLLTREYYESNSILGYTNIIQESLNKHHEAWLHRLVSAQQIPVLAHLFAEAIGNRLARGEPPFQVHTDLYKKLISRYGTDDKFSELDELQFALNQLRKADNQYSDMAGRRMMMFSDVLVSALFEFYYGGPNDVKQNWVIDALENYFLTPLGVNNDKIVQLTMRKQSLRSGCAKKLKELCPDCPDVELQDISRDVSKLFIPHFIYQAMQP